MCIVIKCYQQSVMDPIRLSKSSLNPWKKYGQHYTVYGSGGLGALSVDTNWNFTKTIANTLNTTDANTGKEFHGVGGVFVMRFKKDACTITSGGTKATKRDDSDGFTNYYFAENDTFTIKPNVDPNA